MAGATKEDVFARTPERVAEIMIQCLLMKKEHSMEIITIDDVDKWISDKNS